MARPENAHSKLIADVLARIQSRVVSRMRDTLWEETERLKAFQACPLLLDQEIALAFKKSGVRTSVPHVGNEFLEPDRMFVYSPENGKDSLAVFREGVGISMDNFFVEYVKQATAQPRRMIVASVKFQPRMDYSLVRQLVARLDNLGRSKVCEMHSELHIAEFGQIVITKGIKDPRQRYVAFVKFEHEKRPTIALVGSQWFEGEQVWHFHTYDSSDTRREMLETNVLFSKIILEPAGKT